MSVRISVVMVMISGFECRKRKNKSDTRMVSFLKSGRDPRTLWNEYL